jgi:charged multivesicular body protein 1
LVGEFQPIIKFERSMWFSGKSSQDRLQESLFQLKFTAKQFEKSVGKAQKDEKQQKDKVKKAIEQGNLDGARIYAQNAIRKKNEAANYLRLSSRLDAVAARMDTAIKMNAVTNAMGSTVKAMDTVLGSMDVEKISGIMDKFEKQFENLDVTSEYMEKSIGQTTAITTPEDEVTSLLSEVADEHGLKLGDQIGSIKTGNKITPESVQKDDLSERLAKLKQGNKN